MTMTQFSGCIWRETESGKREAGSALDSKRHLQPPQQKQRYDLHGHHANERATKSSAIGVGGHRAHGFTRGDARPALSRFTKRRAPPGTPAGSWRKSDSVV